MTTDPTRILLERAVREWEAPRVAGGSLLAHTAGLTRSPAIDAALGSDAGTTMLIRALRQNEGVGREMLPTVVGSSLSARLVRPNMFASSIEKLLAVDNATNMLASVGKKLALLNESLVLPGRRIEDLIESARLSVAGSARYFDEFAQVMREFADSQSDLDEETDIFVARHGWPVPTCLSLGAYRQVVGLAGATRREVSRRMVEWFRPGTRAFSVVRERIDASPDFASRRPLLRQVYAAQRRGHWYVVINGLLPLVEGVLVDATFPSGARPASHKPGVARLMTAPEETFHEPTFRALETMIVGAGSGLALFDRYAPPPGVEPRSLNRHAVLHGSARRYGTRQNATKLFLLIGLLAECLDIYRELQARERDRDDSR